MLIAGIVSIATRKAISGGGTITGIIMYALSGIMGLTMYGVFKDLQIWGGLCLIFAIILLIAQIKGKKSKGEVETAVKDSDKR